MRSRTKEIEITKEAPFANDKLDRQQYANTLTKIIQLMGDAGGVLSINGEWGTGKSTFVSMWKQELDNNNFRTIYFNAWESDFTDDPLVSLISELKIVSKGTDEEPFKTLVANGAKIAFAALTGFGKSFLHSTTGIDADVLKTSCEQVQKIGNSWIEDYEQQKESFSDFKRSLINFVADNADCDRPIVFFIDELDRCNPTYAVKVLERIKHLFDITNLVFVLSINKKQLAYAIQGYFGSEKMNADEYLRKFIDLEYNLPAPDMHKYCQFLFDEYNMAPFFSNRNSHDIEIGDFIRTAGIMAQHSDMNLRELNKLFAHASIALNSFSNSAYFSVSLFFYLCYLRVCQTELFYKIKNRNYRSIQTLYDDMTAKLPIRLLDSSNHTGTMARGAIFALAGVLIGYNVNYNNTSLLFEPNFTGTPIEGKRYSSFPIEPGVVNKDVLFEALSNYEGRACDLYYFDYWLNNVDLLGYLNIQ
ncbi:MAG: KAP family NTPase [Bacteroidales bacterium]|nr:KAP family NTPase [Bacteroidales bacterium]